MTCEHTRERLLELPVDRFPELSAHLATCRACRELADAITTREEHVVRYVEEHLRSDTFDAALAAARAPRPVAGGRWVTGAAIALAAAAALWLALPSAPERSMGAAPPVTAPEADGIELGVGRSAVLALEQHARALTVVDPKVAAVAPLGGADRLRLTGLRPGRTLLNAVLADGAERAWWIVVDADATVPVASDAAEVVRLEERPLWVQVGERHVVDFPWAVSSIDVGDPALAEVEPLGAQRLAIDGLAAGTTDLLARSRSDELALYVITVRE